MNSKLDRAALTLEDFDHLSGKELGQRIHKLGSREIEHLINFEKRHNNRTAVIRVFEGRLHELSEGEVMAEKSHDVFDGELREHLDPDGQVRPGAVGPSKSPDVAADNLTL